MTFPRVETTRLRLRRFEEKDLPLFFEYRNDRALCRFQSWESFDTRALAQFWAEQSALAFGTQNQWTQLAIADRPSDTLLGDCAVCFRSDTQLECGFTMPSVHQGKGLMCEALRALFDWLSVQTSTVTVKAFTDVRNHSAIALLEALQFQRIAHLHRAGFYKGEWCDEYEYRLDLT